MLKSNVKKEIRGKYKGSFLGVLWSFINQGVTTVLANGEIIKKVYFPREILPISVAVSGLINFFISCIIIIAFVLGSGLGLHKYIILLPVIAIIQFMLSLGIIFILSAINIYIRDVEYITIFLLNMLFYGTPILYSVSMFPEKFRWLLNMNPMAHIIQGYRSILYNMEWPDFKMLGLIGIFSFLFMVLGYFVFRTLEKGFAEEV